MADYTTVKTNFVLGPLVLKVEKAFGRGVKRELKSATATTTEMIGRINLRIVNGAATLHSIKVQQPKQVTGYVYHLLKAILRILFESRCKLIVLITTIRPESLFGKRALTLLKSFHSN